MWKKRRDRTAGEKEEKKKAGDENTRDRLIITTLLPVRALPGRGILSALVEKIKARVS